MVIALRKITIIDGSFNQVFNNFFAINADSLSNCFLSAGEISLLLLAKLVSSLWAENLRKDSNLIDLSLLNPENKPSASSKKLSCSVNNNC